MPKAKTGRRGSLSTAALLIDDEPEYLSWVADFLLTYKLNTDTARNLSDALLAIEKREYRVILVDMEIPAIGASGALPRAEGNPVIQKYPGIVAAIKCRTKGYRPVQVIAYTVHDDDAAESELRKLDCPYVLKGRPGDLKNAIRQALAGAPFKGP
jgi:CheY-like chemotaxis protein